jgi:ABC-2 type transport system ATP-binding protein
VIEASHLIKRYGGTVAVDDLTFSIRPGLVTGFLGPNGAGKTTTMRMILGLDAPTQGSVTVGGRSYRDLPAPMREVGALLDAKALHGGRRAYDHLLCLAQSNGIAKGRVKEVLQLVGLEQVAKRRAKGFSLGMGQRLGIAAALLGDPAVLIFDEPVNGLDPEGIVWVRNLMRTLAGEGRTVMVSSHLMSEMALTADHLLVIGRGQLIADTSVDDFIRSNSEQAVHVRSPQAAALADLCRGAGATVRAGSRLATSGNAALGGGSGTGAYPNELNGLPDPDAPLLGSAPGPTGPPIADPYARPVAAAAEVGEPEAPRPPDPAPPISSGQEDADADPDVIEVTGMESEDVGKLAAAHGVVLYELTPIRASLEEAFMELTRDSLEFHATGAVR